MTLFFKYLNITFFTFFINVIYSDSFEDVLYEWTDHMDYQRFVEADKTFIKLQEICDKSSDDKTLISALGSLLFIFLLYISILPPISLRIFKRPIL